MPSGGQNSRTVDKPHQVGDRVAPHQKANCCSVLAPPAPPPRLHLARIVQRRQQAEPTAAPMMPSEITCRALPSLEPNDGTFPSPAVHCLTRPEPVEGA